MRFPWTTSRQSMLSLPPAQRARQQQQQQQCNGKRQGHHPHRPHQGLFHSDSTESFVGSPGQHKSRVPRIAATQGELHKILLPGGALSPIFPHVSECVYPRPWAAGSLLCKLPRPPPPPPRKTFASISYLADSLCCARWTAVPPSIPHCLLWLSFLCSADVNENERIGCVWTYWR